MVLGGVDGTGEYLSDIYITTPLDNTHHGPNTCHKQTGCMHGCVTRG